MNPLQKLIALSASCTLMAGLSTASAAAIPSAPPGFTVSTFAAAPATTPATIGPDDVTGFAGHVFVGWQNGVGTKGEPNTLTGQSSGTLIEYSLAGKALQSWSLPGKIDGLGVELRHRQVIATVNEDGNSSLYTILPNAPAATQVQHYNYEPAPDSAPSGGVLTGGGTDAVTVDNGRIYLSASNPAAANATALLLVTLHPGTGVASLTPTFADNAVASDALTGLPATLALTDPDSNALVPPHSPRFAGQVVLDSQADQQLVFARGLGHGAPKLTRLSMTHSGQPAGVDDVRWTNRSGGTLIVVDNGAETVYAVTGPFAAGQAFASLDTVGSAAQNTEVDTLDLGSGALTPFLTGLSTSKGLLWLREGAPVGGATPPVKSAHRAPRPRR